MRRLSLLVLLAALCAAPLQGAATGTIAPFPKHQFFTNSGVPCASCLLFTYEAGTATKTTTWTNAAMSSANTNPIVLGSDGRAAIFLLPGTSLKFVLAPSTDVDPPLAPIWTIDQVSAVPAGSQGANTEISGTAGENLTTGQAVYLSDGTGGTTTGRWYRMDADAVASSNGAQATGFAVADISLGASGLIRREGNVTGLTGLTAGSLYYASATAGDITATPPTNARIVGQAQSTTELAIVQSLPDASASIAGQITATGNQAIAGAKQPSGQWTFTLPPLGLAQYPHQSASVVKNANTTFADLTGMSFTVGASETYVFDFYVKVTASAAADVKFTLTGPAAPTAVIFGIIASSGTSLTAISEAFGTLVSASTNGGVGQPEWMHISGKLRNGVNAGTVQLQFAQLVSDATNSTAYIESYGYALRVQ